MSKITAEFRLAALRRGLLVGSTKGSSTDAVAFAGSIELANLGFVVDPSALRTVSTEAITDTIKQARKIMGADRDMTPIYPGFPKQVQELSTMTLLIEQILHYWTAGALLPDYPAVVRDGLPIEDMLRNARELRVVGAAAAARELTTALVSNPVAISVDDKALLNAAMELQKPSLEQVVETVKISRNGENVQSFIAAVAKNSGISLNELALAVVPVVANADVLLRVVLALFTVAAPITKTTFIGAQEKRTENYTLAVNNLADRHSRAVLMLNVSRPVRRAVVEKLGKVSAGYKADSVVGRQMLWRKVMTAVHAYDFNLSEAEKRAADIIHSNIDYKTLNSLIEDAMTRREVVAAVELLAENQPGNLLRRLVSLLRLVNNSKEAKFLAKTVRKVGAQSALTTLISAYNGVIAANDNSARVTRIAGLSNTMVNRNAVVKVEEEYIAQLCKALKKAIKENLAKKDAPVGPVPVKSSMAVPLVRRDAATTDREMERGADFAVAGEGDTLRIFSHWNNNQSQSGYMDIGLVILDSNFETLAVLTWNSWAQHRDLGTYSGDKNVRPGSSAAEYFDLDLKKVRAKFPHAIYAAMTIQSWSGWPTSKVDIIAGAMLRSKPDSGEVFDARSIATAFKPTTDSTQSVPFAVDLRSGKMVWIDSSNGSTASGTSSTNDDSIGSIVYDELERPRLTLGELATLWAKAHGAETVDGPVDQKELVKLL
jgi:ribosomal protein L12E/L44/L45/RPP1/RPP2